MGPKSGTNGQTDLAKTVKVRSDHSDNLTVVFGGAKNGYFS